MSLIFVTGSLTAFSGFLEETSELTLGLLGVCLSRTFYIIIYKLSRFIQKIFPL